MTRWIGRSLLLALCLWVLPLNTPAPLTYRQGEGWTYEKVGGGQLDSTRAKDQLEMAQEAFDKQDYKLSLKAARRTVRVWPLSDYAPQAQYLMARCMEAKGQDEKAFKAYQNLLEKYPKAINYEEVVQRQYQIANRIPGGQTFPAVGLCSVPPVHGQDGGHVQEGHQERSVQRSGAQAQMNIGAAREKQSDFRKR